MSSFDPDLALSFAQAVSAPDEQAMLIDSDGRRAGYRPLALAARSGLAFAVAPRDGIAAFDVDGPKDHDWAEVLWRWARSHGIATVLTESGRPEHWSLWVVAPVGWNHAHLANVVRRELVDTKVVPRHQTRLGGALMRPPMSPHRYITGAVSAVLAPPDVHSALRMLQKRPGTIPLGDTARRKLRDPLPRDRHTRLGTESRRALAQAIVTAHVRADRTLGEVRAAFADPQNRGGEWYRARDTQARGADRELGRMWREQLAHLRETRDESPAGFLREHLLLALACVDEQLDWEGPPGDRDRCVLRALLGRAALAARNPVAVDQRSLALDSGLSRNGVIASLERLTTRGLVKPQASTESGQATSYRICLSSWSPYAGETNRGLFYTGGQDSYLVRATWVWRDLFSDSPVGGLGISRQTTYECLPTDQLVSTQRVEELRPVRATRRAVLDQLRCLEGHGLVERRGQRWRALEPTVEQTKQLAQELGVLGVGRGRAMTYERERDEFVMARIRAAGDRARPVSSVGSTEGRVTR